MLTVKIASNCLVALSVLSKEMGVDHFLNLEEDVLEEMIGLNSHMTRQIEEFIQREALELGLIFIRSHVGYTLIRPVWQVARGYAPTVINGAFHRVV